MVGKNLSHYKILEELGRGGMGIVYKAEDTKLDRTVAIKVLPSAALASEDDRARFYREAKAAAQLHHPNIASVFEIDEAVPEGSKDDDLRPFIAMEFIDGETLYEYIQKGPLTLTEAVQVAAQVADALKAAHAKEIVHRDIKSANVMLTDDGVAKVLDFGLAKTNQSTMLTKMGSTLGTVAYMSPEQARGQDVDGRTDLYSLGTMLYEMIAGEGPFVGEYEQAVIYSILNETPEPLTARRTGVPMQLEWIVNKLLSKEPDYRYQTAADLLADLKTVDLSGSGTSRRSMSAVSVAAMPASQTDTRKAIISFPLWGWAAFVGIILAAAAAGWFFRPAPESPLPPAVRISLLLPEEEALIRLNRQALAISPDGRLVAYRTTAGIMLRRLENLDRSTLLVEQTGLTSLEFSPDNVWLSYVDVGSRLMYRVQVSGGSPVQTAELPIVPAGIHWASDGYVYVGLGDDGLARVPDTGGEIEELKRTDLQYFTTPYLLPGERYLLYGQRDSPSISSLRMMDLETSTDTLIMAGVTDPRYIESLGKLVVYNEGSLFELPFDLSDLNVTGGLIPLEQNIAYARNAGAGHYDLSENGTFVRLFGSFSGSGLGDRLEWFTPGVGNQAVSQNVRAYNEPRVSPDGRQIIVADDNESSSLMMDAERGASTTFQSNAYVHIWSPDGTRTAHGTDDGHLIISSVDDPTSMDTLLTVGGRVTASDWSRDGRFIFYFRDELGNAHSDIEYFDTTTNEVTVFLGDDSDTDFARLSSDGSWLAYENSDTNNLIDEEIVLRRFPRGDNPLQISDGGGTYPVWDPDGEGVLFITQDGDIFRVDFNTETGEAGTQQLIYDGRRPSLNSAAFDVHPLDGRILVITPDNVDQETSEVVTNRRLTFVVNWTTDIQKR